MTKAALELEFVHEFEVLAVEAARAGFPLLAQLVMEAVASVREDATRRSFDAVRRGGVSDG